MQLGIAAGKPARIAALPAAARPRAARTATISAPALRQHASKMRVDEGEGRIRCERDALARRRQRCNGARRSPCDRRGASEHGVEVEPAFGHLRRRSMRAGRSPCSLAWTRPRCRSGKAIRSSRGSAPMTGMPSVAIASATIARWRSLPTRLRTRRRRGRRVVQARSRAPAPPRTAPGRDVENQHDRPARIARRGRRSAPVAVGTGTPSNSPITPSITSMSASRAAFGRPARRSATAASPSVSRLKQRRAGGRGVKRRVDVVGTRLGGAHARRRAALQRRKNAKRHRRLAGAGGRGGDDEAARASSRGLSFAAEREPG